MRLLGGGRFVEVYPRKNRRFRQPVLDYLEAVTDAVPDVLVERVMGHAYGELRLKSTQDLVRSTNLRGEVLEQAVTRLEASGALIRFPDDRFLHRDGYVELKDELVDLLAKMHRVQRLKETLPKDAPRLQLSWAAPDTVYDAMLKDLDAEDRIVRSGRSIRLASHAVKLSGQEECILEAFEELGAAEPPAVFNLNDLLQVMEDRAIAVTDLQVDLKANADMIKNMAGYALDREGLRRVRGPADHASQSARVGQNAADGLP